MKSGLIFFLSVALHFCAVAQLSSSDSLLIATLDHTDHRFDPRKPSFLKVGNNVVTQYNPVSLLFGGALYVYQKFISPQLQSNCPYEVSCSAFSKVAIQEFGLIKGVALTADRLTRCTQLTMYDLLPSQINEENGRIRDDLSKYRLHPHTHTH